MFEVGRLVARVALEGAQTFGRDIDKLGKDFQGLDDKGKRATEKIGTGLTVVGAAITGLAGLAIVKFASFDAAMSKVSATTGENAANMGKLRQAAIEAGASSVFTAGEAANAQVELAKAGVKTADILGGGLAGSLALAAAGEISVAEAAETAATAMTQFRLSGDKIPHLADLLAAGAGKAQGGVTELSAALKQSGLVASQMGLSVEDTVGTLAAFASAGLIGSDAGTSFKTMLLSLANPSAEAAAAMKEYNIQAYDAQGNFVGITSLAGQLKTGMKDATQAQRDQALATIFGSDAIRAANVLYTQGAAGIRDWTNDVNDAGYAARQAAEMQNNLAGDVEKLGGALDSALIQSGSGANEVLRTMTQFVTDLVDAYGSLPPWLQETAGSTALVTGAILLAGGAFMLGVPKIVEYRVAMQTLSTSVPALTGNLGKAAAFLTGPWGLALGAAAIGVTLLQNYLDGLKSTTAEMTNALTTATDAQTLFSAAAKGTPIETYDLSLKNLNEDLKLIAESQKNAWTQYTPDFQSSSIPRLQTILADLGDELASVAEADMPAALRAFDLLVQKTDGSDESVLALLDSMDGFRDKLIDQATALGINVDEMSEAERNTLLLGLAQEGAAGSAETQAEGLAALKGEAEGAVEGVEDLADAIRNFGSAQFDVNSATRAFEQSVDDLSDGLARQKEEWIAAGNSAATFTNSLDIGTQAGRDNQAALDEIASSTLDLAAATYEQTNSQEDANAQIATGRQKLIESLAQFGITGAAAEAYADKLGLIPGNVYTAAKVTGVTEAEAILQNLAKNRTAIITAQIKQTGADPGQVKAAYQAHGGNVKFFAGGGENRAPQFARAGDWRVWAEPETKGEWYFPENEAHRAAGLANAAKMLAGWGYDVVRHGSREGNGGSGESRVIKKIEVIAAPGMDEEAIANRVFEKVERAFG